HDARSIIDNNVDSRAFLEGPDIAPLASYDPPFHIITGDVDGADGRVGGMGGAIALDGGHQYFLGFLLGNGAQVFLALLDAGRDFVTERDFQPLHQHLLGLVTAEIGDLVQLLALFLNQLVELPAAVFDVLTTLAELALGMFKGAFFLELSLMFLIKNVL